MAALGKKLRTLEGGGIAFYCPGCESTHQIRISGNAPWSFDGNADAPTFSPSVLVTSGHFLVEHQPGESCWCIYNAANPGKPAPFVCARCHTFVRAGQIEFLNDCTHALAGQTVPMPDWPADNVSYGP